MRTLLTVPLLAVAATAFDFNAYHNGFIEQIGFTSAQGQDGMNCVTVVSTTVTTLVSAIKAEDFSTAISTVMAARTEIPQACQAVAGDLQAYVAAHATTTPQLAFHEYFPELVHEVALWGDLLAKGQDEQAGEQEAYILQVLIGAETPQAIAAPAFNATSIVPFDHDTFATQFFGAFFNTLGFSQGSVDISAVQQCMSAIHDQIPNFQNFEQNFAAADFDAKIDSMQALADNILATVRNCQGAIDVDMLILEPIFEAFKADPVHFLLTYVNNFALNLPEIIDNKIVAHEAVMAGNYSEAGILSAENLLTKLNGTNVVFEN